jgi:AAA family ATP:ADP antiporter
MISRFFKKIKREYISYSKWEKLFIFCMMVCSFAITGEASVTRATSNSVFIATYTVKFFPIAWLALVPLNLLVVALYNRFLPTIGCVWMLLSSIFISGCVNLFSAFYLDKIQVLPLILYLWKDIFIILMFQQLWSVIHATVNISRARYLYGIFFGMGGLGSIAGSMIPGFFAMSVGSARLLLTTIPFYIVVGYFYYFAIKTRQNIPTSQDISLSDKKSSDVAGGLKLIYSSRLLQFILLLVIFMQVSATILDYQFARTLELEIPHTDQRTAFIGRFFSLVNMVNIFLQFVGSFILLKIIGLKYSHFMVPFILLCNSIGYIIRPSFAMISITFASVKSLDYSIFGIIKEMLYIPLKVDEKFKAKAIIDVFVYRTAKACASFFILIIQIIAPFALDQYMSWSLVWIFIVWIGVIFTMFKYYYQEVEKQPINWPEYGKFTIQESD